MINAELINTTNQKDISKRKKIKYSKEYYSLKQEIKIPIHNCVICGKPCDSFCKSHSIPQFILKKLSKNGKILIGHNFQQMNFEKESGVKNTLIFSCICNDCDNTFFQEYENPDSFKSNVSNVAINEIAIKIFLKHYYKRLWEREGHKIRKEQFNKKLFYRDASNLYFDNKLLTDEMDINDAAAKIKYYLRHKTEKLFYIIDEIDLDYSTDIAFQGFLNLSQGFDGTINDLYNYDPKYKMELLFLCIFPFDNKTKILVFCEDGCVRMRKFYKTYKKQDIKKKLYILNYLMLLYDEEWCVSGDFDKKTLNKETISLINQMTDFFCAGTDKQELFEKQKEIRDRQVKEVFKIETDGNIYNFLEKH